MASMDPLSAVFEHVSMPDTYGAQPHSVRVVKTRNGPSRHLYAVTFTAQSGLDMLAICDVRASADGSWAVHGSAGGGIDHAPQREAAWANLGGSPGGGTSGFYFGGRVESDIKGDVARVRLVSAKGIIQDDTVNDGFVLFMGDEPLTLPVSAELYDEAGTLIASRVVFDLPH